MSTILQISPVPWNHYCYNNQGSAYALWDGTCRSHDSSLQSLVQNLLKILILSKYLYHLRYNRIVVFDIADDLDSLQLQCNTDINCNFVHESQYCLMKVSWEHLFITVRWPCRRSAWFHINVIHIVYFTYKYTLAFKNKKSSHL